MVMREGVAGIVLDDLPDGAEWRRDNLPCRGNSQRDGSQIPSSTSIGWLVSVLGGRSMGTGSWPSRRYQTTKNRASLRCDQQRLNFAVNALTRAMRL